MCLVLIREGLIDLGIPEDRKFTLEFQIELSLYLFNLFLFLFAYRLCLILIFYYFCVCCVCAHLHVCMHVYAGLCISEVDDELTTITFLPHSLKNDLSIKPIAHRYY